MRAIPIVAVAKDGRAIDAVQVACPECDGATFALFVIAGHNHLRCNNCETAFCQQGTECGAGLPDDAPDPRDSDAMPPRMTAGPWGGGAT